MTEEELAVKRAKALNMLAEMQTPAGAERLRQCKLLINTALLALLVLFLVQIMLSYTLFKPACEHYISSLNTTAHNIDYAPSTGKSTAYGSFSGYCEYQIAQGETKRVKFGLASGWLGFLSIFYKFSFGYLICFFLVYLTYLKPRVKKLAPAVQEALKST